MSPLSAKPFLLLPFLLSFRAFGLPSFEAYSGETHPFDGRHADFY
jgi:hypothetical protein